MTNIHLLIDLFIGAIAMLWRHRNSRYSNYYYIVTTVHVPSAAVVPKNARLRVSSGFSFV